MGLFNRARDLAPEQQFWQWFALHEADLFHFERDQERVFHALAGALSRVHPDLTFEFGPPAAGRRELVLSADGIRKAFPAVEALVAAAPPLTRWQVTKFRPRREVAGHLDLGDTRVSADEIWVHCEPDGERWGLTLHIRGYHDTPDHCYERIGYLWLDQALGEYDVETRVGFIEFAPLPDHERTGLIPLRDLPTFIDHPPAS